MLGRIGTTLEKYARATKARITGFPTRRQAAARQHATLDEYNETYWNRLSGAVDEETAEEQMDELANDFLEDQQLKVRDWYERTQTSGVDGPERTAADTLDYTDIDRLLEKTSETTADGVRNWLLPRYMNEDDEFGKSRSWMMNRIDQLPADPQYNDPQYRARLADDDIQTELLKSELRVYGLGFSLDAASQIAETVAEQKQEYRKSGEAEREERFGDGRSDRLSYLQERISSITERDQNTDPATLARLVASYVQEHDVFGAERRTLVDRLVDADQYSYDELGTKDDADIWKKLLEAEVRDAGSGLSERETIELAVYAEELRDMNGDYDAPEPVDDTGADKEPDENDGDPQTDGGVVPATAPASVSGTALPDTYIDEPDYTVENEFLTTGYNRFQKVDTGDGYAYLKNGIPVSQQSYAGASAHRLPGEVTHL